MKRSHKISLIALPLIVVAVAVLIIFIPARQTAQLRAVCRVKAATCYVLPLAGSDTLYLSLRNDSLQDASTVRAAVSDTADQSGAFVSNGGDIVTSDAIVGGQPSVLPAAQVRQRLQQLDTLLVVRLANLQGEQKELDYYARTHSVVDDGYNDVMAYREKVRKHAERVDSALRLVGKYKQSNRYAAHLDASVEVTSAYVPTKLKAHLRCHKNGLMLLQLDTLCLPDGCSRFSVYRFGVRTLRSRLFAYNDMGSRSQNFLPAVTDSDRELFAAAEGGVWVNRSGHISGVQRGAARVSSVKLAQLMAYVHYWPVWWWKNATAWVRSFHLRHDKAVPVVPRTDLTCVRNMPVADSLKYEGQVDCRRKVAGHWVRQGYGRMANASGTLVFEGTWHNDTLKAGKRIDQRGVYEDNFDGKGRADGSGKLYAADGEFYDGEWKADKRSGHGFSSRNRHIVRCGSWKNDRFQGERMIYTADRVYGIDISRHQHELGRRRYGIDWSKLRIYSLGGGRRVRGVVDYPVSFAYIKATEGRTVYNKYYPSDLRQARRHGIHVGSYHFFSTRSTGAQQAAYFLKMAWVAQSDLPPVLDLEPTDAQIRQMGGDGALFRQVLNWLQIVERRHGKRPILYVGQLFVNNHLKHAPAALRKYDVWIARYGEFKPYVHLLHWQLTPYGRVRGIRTEVDVNVFNGSKEEFAKYVKGEK